MPEQPLDVDEFDGGITDYYVGSPLNRYQKADNLLLIKHDKKARLFTRPGSEIWDSVNFQIPAGAQRIGTMKYFSNTLLVHSARKIYYVLSGAWTTLQGPSGNDVFPAGVTVNNYTTHSTWQNHWFVTTDAYKKPQKIYRDQTGTLRLRTAGMPIPATNPTVTPTGNTGKNYLYRFTYRYTYQVGTLTYIDEGSFVEVAVTNSDDPGTNQNNITAIPVLTNGVIDNYDTAVVEVVLYRTVNNGDVFYQFNTVTNGTTSFVDNVPDSVLQNNVTMYTEGDVVANDAPPLANIIHINQQRGYYADIMEGSEIRKNRLLQSIDGDPDSVPATFFVDIDDDIIGVSSVKDAVVLCCKKSTWRVDGAFDLTGRGGMVAQKISDTSSCVSSQSVVQTLDGVFWAGEDSFYYSDGYRVIKLNRGWDQTHAQLVNLTSKAEARKRIQGKYDPRTRRIYWSVWASASNSDNDSLYVLDLNWPYFMDSVSDGTFTSWSGNANFAPTAIEFIDAALMRGDKRGYIFRHRANLYTDPRVDTLLNPSLWSTSTIIYDYRGAATNFGSNFLRKFTNRISVVCKNETNLALQIVSNSNDNKKIEDLKPIRFRGNMTWGDPDVYWGDPNIIWNYDGLIDQQRRFPSASLRCSYKQIYLTNAFVVIVSSDLIGQATVNNVAHTATLINTATFDWPTNAVDYYIAFEADNYVREYLITARTSDVITFTDPMGFAPSTAQKWVIRGFPKGDIMNLISYTIHYTPMGETQTPFTIASTGEVGS